MQKDEQKQLVNSIHLVCFFLANEEYGINLQNVKEIIKVCKITPVPKTREHIKGIINLRGNVIPVMDVRECFSLEKHEKTDNNRIVIVEKETKSYGIIVDSVSEVMHIPFDLLEPPPESEKIKKEFLKGVVNMEDRLIILLNIRHVLTI